MPFGSALRSSLIVLALVAQQSALARVSDEQAQRGADGKVVVTWKSKASVDVYIADRPDARLEDAKLAARGNRAGRLEVAVDPTDRPYFLLKEAGDERPARVAERVLPLTQGSNFRDLGGYPAADGKRVRWGLLYRSAASPVLTDGDLKLLHDLGIKDLIDLRATEERTSAPTRLDGIRYTAVGYPRAALGSGGTARTAGAEAGVQTRTAERPDAERSQNASLQAMTVAMERAYRVFPTLLAPHYRILFKTLLNGEGPVAYNCTAGQDRTGLASIFILTILGVSQDVILADYHLSTPSRRPEFEKTKEDFATVANTPGAHAHPLYDSGGRSLFEIAFKEIDAKWGSLDAYLEKEIGVTQADRIKLRQMYLE